MVAGVAAAGADGSPALNGNYFGIRTAFKPFSALNLALNYATNLGNRSAIGVDGGLELGPLSLSALWVCSQTPGSPVANCFNNALSDWAYYVQGETKLGPISLSANYHAVDPQYADGLAGMSENEDTTYYGGLKAGAPYGADTRGLGFSASVGFGPLSLKGYAESETTYGGGLVLTKALWAPPSPWAPSGASASPASTTASTITATSTLTSGTRSTRAATTTTATPT